MPEPSAMAVFASMTFHSGLAALPSNPEMVPPSIGLAPNVAVRSTLAVKWPEVLSRTEMPAALPV